MTSANRVQWATFDVECKIDELVRSKFIARCLCCTRVWCMFCLLSHQWILFEIFIECERTTSERYNRNGLIFYFGSLEFLVGCFFLSFRLGSIDICGTEGESQKYHRNTMWMHSLSAFKITRKEKKKQTVIWSGVAANGSQRKICILIKVIKCWTETIFSIRVKCCTCTYLCIALRMLFDSFVALISKYVFTYAFTFGVCVCVRIYVCIFCVDHHSEPNKSKRWSRKHSCFLN